MATEDYGSDIDCVTGFAPHLPVISGKLVVAQACARRLQVPRGRMALLGPAYVEYGYDLRQFLNGHGSIDEIASGVAEECEKDERVRSAQVSAVQTDNTVTVTVEIDPDNETDPFEFVFTITAAKASLLLA